MAKTFFLLLPILILMLGLPIMAATSSLTPSPRLACITILIAFIGYNFLCSYFLNLVTKLRKAWAPRKIWHLFPGFCIGSVPIGLAYAWQYSMGELSPYQGITILTGLLTLATVAWEELWFRGIALELAGYRYSKIGAALIFGLIFALLHLMNPKVNLLDDGFQLALAGYTLSVCYFAFGSIWAPIGMHFANNSIQAVFGKSVEPGTMTYMGPLILIAILFTFIVWRRALKKYSAEQ
jgi:membrane protease YdiL (CAAX protease family)